MSAGKSIVTVAVPPAWTGWTVMLNMPSGKLAAGGVVRGDGFGMGRTLVSSVSAEAVTTIGSLTTGLTITKVWGTTGQVTSALKLVLPTSVTEMVWAPGVRRTRVNVWAPWSA